jgi:hypothetical protein
MESTSSDELRDWIARLQEGEAGAREHPIGCAFDRLDRLAGRVLRNFPRVARWEEGEHSRRCGLRCVRTIPGRSSR